MLNLTALDMFRRLMCTTNDLGEFSELQKPTFERQHFSVAIFRSRNVAEMSYVDCDLLAKCYTCSDFQTLSS